MDPAGPIPVACGLTGLPGVEARKSIRAASPRPADQGGKHQLKRTLGAGNLVALGIGAIIGAGLFSLTGVAAAQNAGPAVTLSMVVAAIGCAFFQRMTAAAAWSKAP